MVTESMESNAGEDGVVAEPRVKDVACQTESKLVDSSTQTGQSTMDKCVGDDVRYVGFHGFRTVQNKELVLKDLTSITLNVFFLLMNLFPKGAPRINELGLEDKLLDSY